MRSSLTKINSVTQFLKLTEIDHFWLYLVRGGGLRGHKGHRGVRGRGGVRLDFSTAQFRGDAVFSDYIRDNIFINGHESGHSTPKIDRDRLVEAADRPGCSHP